MATVFAAASASLYLSTMSGNLPERISAPRRAAAPLVRRALARRESGVLLALAVLVVAMSLASPYFLRPLNLFNVLRGG
jgi:hypothetical protein